MERLPLKEAKERSGKLAELCKEISFKKNQAWTNWAGKILVDEKGKKASSWMGRNFAYKTIVIKSGEFLLGKSVKVCVMKTFPTYLEAEIV